MPKEYQWPSGPKERVDLKKLGDRFTQREKTFFAFYLLLALAFLLALWVHKKSELLNQPYLSGETSCLVS